MTPFGPRTQKISFGHGIKTTSYPSVPDRISHLDVPDRIVTRSELGHRCPRSDHGLRSPQIDRDRTRTPDPDIPNCIQSRLNLELHSDLGS